MPLSSLKKLLNDSVSRYVTTLRQKIFLMAVPVLVLTSFVYTFEALRTERAIMKEEIVKRAAVVTELAAYLGELPLISENPELITKSTLSITTVPEVTFVAFYDSRAKLLAKQGDTSIPTMELPPLEMEIIERKDYFDLSSPVFTLKALEDIDIFQETERDKESREMIGWVRIGFSKSAMKEAERSILYKGLLIAVTFIIFSSLVLYKLAKTATMPLAMLSSAVQRIRKGEYPEIDIPSGDEIGTLTSEFNRMSSTIKEREAMLVNRAHLSAFVAHIGMVLTESESMQTILQHCTDIMVHHFDASLARIWIYERDNKNLDLLACSGIYSLDKNPYSSIVAGKFEAGNIALNRRSYYTNNIENLVSEEKAWASENGIRAFAGYPLIVENRLVGVLEVFSRSRLSEDVFNTLDTVADEIALGIQHKRVEQQIKASLAEKEVLLREIHHRVKNNMQVITSLLSLQAEQIKESEYVDKFNDSKNRIKSMALVHEKLYQSKDMSNIDLNDYIVSLTNGLFSSYEASARNISLRMDIDNISFGIDTAIPCGLVINELVSNCLKHAFPEGRRGEITVSLKSVNGLDPYGYKLIVSDNGIGMPAGINIRESASLGLQLITTLVEHQLQGRIDMVNDNGLSFNIFFQEISYRKRI